MTAGVVIVLVGAAVTLRLWDASAYTIRLLPLRLRVELVQWSWAPSDAWLPSDLAGVDDQVGQRAFELALVAGASGQNQGAKDLAISLYHSGEPRVNARALPPSVVRGVLRGGSSDLKFRMVSLIAEDEDVSLAGQYLPELLAALFDPSPGVMFSVESLARRAKHDPTVRFGLGLLASQASPPFTDGYAMAVIALARALPESSDEVLAIVQGSDPAPGDVIFDVLRFDDEEIGDEQIAPLHATIAAIITDPGHPLHISVMGRLERFPCGVNGVIADLLTYSDARTVDALTYPLRNRRSICMAELLPGIRSAARRQDLPAWLRRVLVETHEQMRLRSGARDERLVVPELDELPSDGPTPARR